MSRRVTDPSLIDQAMRNLEGSDTEREASPIGPSTVISRPRQPTVLEQPSFRRATRRQERVGEQEGTIQTQAQVTSNTDRQSIERLRVISENAFKMARQLQSAKPYLDLIDEGPISGRVGSLMSNFNVGENVAAYQEVNRIAGVIGNIGLRDVGGSDTEKEFERLRDQTISVKNLPEINMKIIQDSVDLADLASRDVELAEMWVKTFGSLSNTNDQNQTFEAARRQLRRSRDRRRDARRTFERDGYSITPIN